MRTQKIMVPALLALALLASGCASKNDQAAKICRDEAINRADGRTVTLDLKALAAAAVPESDGSLRLTAPIVFNAALSTERKHTLSCNVRFSDKGAELVSLSFVY